MFDVLLLCLIWIFIDKSSFKKKHSVRGDYAIVHGETP